MELKLEVKYVIEFEEAYKLAEDNIEDAKEQIAYEKGYDDDFDYSEIKLPDYDIDACIDDAIEEFRNDADSYTLEEMIEEYYDEIYDLIFKALKENKVI